MEWLPIKEVAKQSGRSERTLRSYASQGKIKSKKDGKHWLCEITSLKNVGITLADISARVTADMPKTAAKFAANGKDSAEKTKKSVVPAKNYADAEDSRGNAAKGSAKNGNREYKKLRDLGVYRDLISIWNSTSFESMENVKIWLQRGAEQIAIGFYEFHGNRKMEYFRNARECILKAMVDINMRQDESALFLMEELEEKIVPSLIGLIKRAEKLKR